MKHKAEMPVQHHFPYQAMSLRNRKKILPKRNVCSLYPAERGGDALSTGNGRQRVNVWGDPYRERCTFSHELLYEPLWERAPEPPDFTGIMPQVRKLLLEGKYEEAADLAETTRLNDPIFAPWKEQQENSIYPIGSPRLHDAFDLDILQTEQPETRNYLRFLDMLTGCVTVRWENDLGSFRRETVVAYQGDVNAIRLTCAPGEKIDARIRLTTPVTRAKSCGASFAMRIGALQNPDKCEERISVLDDTIVLELAYCPEYGRKGYVSALRFIPEGGAMELTESGARVTGASSLLLLAKTEKCEQDFTFGQCAGTVQALQAFVASADTTSALFENILNANRAYLGERMERSEIVLGDAADYALSSEELMQRMHSERELDPMLLNKLFDCGRFFQITDTGEIPPFLGQHNINTNLQVCAGNNTGLFDEMDVYFRYYETKFDDFRTNARKLFGARGLLASVHCDYDSGLYYHFSKAYPHYCWTGCLGWIYNEFWGYYLVTGDLDFLARRVVPALKEIALFYEDYACDIGPDGHAIFYPSFSPENPTPVFAGAETTYATRINSVMDIMICREVLDNLMEACETLGIEQENMARWQKQRDLLPRYLLDEEGGLKEWAWSAIPENYNHRHVSHHYDVWPGHYVTWEEQPHLARAIRISNRKRSHQDDSAHGVIHRLFSAIRLKDEEETVQNLSVLLCHGYVTRALSTQHFPYYAPFPDLQGAMPAVLLEMCVFSAPGTIEFFPAMPDTLSEGSLNGVWLYTWAKLESLVWDESGFCAEIVSNREQILTLRYRKRAVSFAINGRECELDGDHVICNVKAGERILLKVVK